MVADTGMKVDTGMVTGTAGTGWGSTSEDRGYSSLAPGHNSNDSLPAAARSDGDSASTPRDHRTTLPAIRLTQ
jgi:hypothetical protein